MTTTSTTFGLILATASDTVDVVTQVAANFSSLDSILSIAHTGTGQLRSGVVMVNPVFTNPSLTGTISGGVVNATTGAFQTITATGGSLTVNTFNIGTYSVPSTIGATNQLLTVITGNAQWVSAAPGTGAAADLSNLAAVAINTNLGTFSAGFVTVNRILATSGALTGLTVFQATTGTFNGNVTITGTITANVINATGGTITAGGLSIGTYALPSTIGATGQLLTVTTGNAVWLTPNLAQTKAYFNVYMLTATQSGPGTLVFDTKRFDTSVGYDTGAGTYTVTASGYYCFGANIIGKVSTDSVSALVLILSGSGGPYVLDRLPSLNIASGSGYGLSGSITLSAGSGNAYSVLIASTGTFDRSFIAAAGTLYPSFWGYKIPDM